MNKPLSIKKDRTRTNAGKEAAINTVTADDYLTGPASNGRFDLDKRIHKGLKNLANATETDDGKSVSMRMLITEALLDLFDKYDEKKGKYPLEQGEEWSWKDK